MVKLERATGVGGGHLMFTIGNPEKLAIRMTRGRITNQGNWRGWQPCIFVIKNGKRTDER